jgi:hypothetical protein
MALVKGDIAFNSFNADEDGWSIVAFVDIDPNTTIYFSDGTAVSPTSIGSTESLFQWNTGPNPIPAGTVVRFSAVDTVSRAASIGTFTVVNSANIGLSATSETVYAFLGVNATDPTTILTAVSNEALETSLTAVGLTAGINAIKLNSSADYGVYNGSRTELSSFSDYKTLVNNVSTWIVDTVNGDNAATVPNITRFGIANATPAVNLSISSTLIADNDASANNAAAPLKKVGSFTSANGAEIPAFDAASDRLFVVAGSTVEVYSVSNAGALALTGALAPGFIVSAGTEILPNSVAVKNGIVAVAYAIRETVLYQFLNL